MILYKNKKAMGFKIRVIIEILSLFFICYSLHIINFITFLRIRSCKLMISFNDQSFEVQYGVREDI